MQSFPIEEIDPKVCFPQLLELPQPPKKLYMRGSLVRTQGTIFLAVVGSRKFSPYGKQVCESLIKGLAGYPITIVSGLAIGIDAIAHTAAIEAGLTTIAFPGSGLDWHALYPQSHIDLAKRILEKGGALLSEFDHDTVGAPWTFPTRNRLEAGISNMVLIIEAEEKSGTLITARLATEYNKIVGVVPGAITSSTAQGANWLLRLGAVPITSSDDILTELNLKGQATLPFESTIVLNDTEEEIVAALTSAKSKEVIIEELGLDTITATIAFSTLEIKGVIRETYGLIERII